MFLLLLQRQGQHTALEPAGPWPCRPELLLQQQPDHVLLLLLLLLLFHG
jgi:hypothetical protein